MATYHHDKINIRQGGESKQQHHQGFCPRNFTADAPGGPHPTPHPANQVPQQTQIGNGNSQDGIIPPPHQGMGHI